MIVHAIHFVANFPAIINILSRFNDDATVISRISFWIIAEYVGVTKLMSHKINWVESSSMDFYHNFVILITGC